MLNSKPARRLRAGTLARWFDRRFDAARTDRGRLTLSTVHSAKGREFRRVVILDGGDWREKSDPERRLYYVGMTRAKENLVLCQSLRGSNPFSPPLGGESIVRTDLSRSLQRPKHLGWKYVSLSLADVDLGFGGRQAPGHAYHRAVEKLEHGEPIDLDNDGQRMELRSRRDNNVIGRLSKKFALPAGKIVAVSVDALVRRSQNHSSPDYAHLDKVPQWWVVLATIVIE